MQDDNAPKPGEKIAPEPTPQVTAPVADNSQESAANESSSSETGWAFTDSSEKSEPKTEMKTIQWTASEYIAHDKTPTWFAAIAAGAAVVASIIYFVTGELLASITIIIVTFVAMYYSARKPETRHYDLSGSTLKIDGKSYPINEFRSFSVVREGAIESIWLDTLSKLSPTIRIYFAPEDAEAITGALSQVLPYQQKELDAVEKVSRRIRF